MDKKKESKTSKPTHGFTFKQWIIYFFYTPGVFHLLKFRSGDWDLYESYDNGKKGGIVRSVKMYGRIPTGWGVIKYIPRMKYATIAPIPLNLILRWIDSLWWYVIGTKVKAKRTEKAWFDGMVRGDVKGYARGHREGYGCGYREGFKACQIIYERKWEKEANGEKDEV